MAVSARTAQAETADPLTTPPERIEDALFVRRVLVVMALLAAAALAVFLSDLLMLVIAAILVAVVLRAVADLITRIVPMKERWAVVPAALLILGVLVLAVSLFGRQMAEQVTTLVGMLPGALARLKTQFADDPIFAAMLEQLEDAGEYAGTFAAQVPGWALGAAGALANIGLGLVGGIMLALEPRAYRDGFLLLFPERQRGEIRATLNGCGHALKGWLLAQFVSMIIIGVLTGIGLWLAGEPSAIGLGVFAGIAQFVPLLGPFVSAVPGLLISATVSLDVFLLALLVYVGVQQLEGNLVTPMVQRHLAGLPMALALFAMVAFGALFGILGVVLATPLTIIALVLVRGLYIRGVLGEKLLLPGERPPAGAETAPAQSAQAGAAASAARGQ